MMWSDKAFKIYMGDAGFVAPLEAVADDTSSFDVKASRVDAGTQDPCSDGDTRRGWLTRAGTSLTDTQLHGAVRG